MLTRSITHDDLKSVVSVHAASRRLSEQGVIRDHDLDRDTAEDFHAMWQKWMDDDEIYKICLEDDGVIKGLCLYGRTKTRPSFDRGVVPKFGAEIYALYVDPDCLRQGIGKKLFQSAVDDLISQNHSGLILWGLKKNKRAVAFYESLKAERVGKQRVDMGRDSWAEETCFAWKDIRKIKF